MTLTQLRYIVAIVDAGLNITAAANRIYATQPTISKQLKLLEGELGFQLFTRRGKSLNAVTPAGEQVINTAREVVDKARDIRSLAADLRGEGRGQLTIVTTHTQARFFLPTPVREFRRRYPAVTVHLKPQADAGILEQFSSGRDHVALVSTSGDSRPQAGLAIPVYRWSRAVAVPKAHALADLGRPLRLQDLAEHPLVSYDSSLRPESSLQRAFRDLGLVPRLAFTSGDADLIKTYTRTGAGVGILAQMAVDPHDQRDLAILDASSLFPDCTTWLVLRRDRVLRSFVLALVRELAPHVDPRDVRAALDDEPGAQQWPEAPHWGERLGAHPRLRAIA